MLVWAGKLQQVVRWKGFISGKICQLIRFFQFTKDNFLARGHADENYDCYHAYKRLNFIMF